MPTTHGENIVLRVLDRQKGIVSLDALGLSDDALATLRLMMARPEGIILVTGPTGSGKTTTLYSMLNHLMGVRKCSQRRIDGTEEDIAIVMFALGIIASTLLAVLLGAVAYIPLALVVLLALLARQIT